MKRLMQWSAAHPVLSLSLVLLGTVLALAGALRIQWDPSMRGMVIEGGEDHRYYRRTVASLGTDCVSVVFVRDRDLFSPGKLEALHEMVLRLGELPEVDRVESLFSVLRLDPGPEGMIEVSPVVDWLPQTREDAYRIRHAALHNPILVNNLVSPDGTATVVNLYLDAEPSTPDFDRAFSRKVDEVVAPRAGSFQELFQLGVPYANRMLSQGMMTDMARLVPLSVGVLLLTFGLLLRSAVGILLPLITGALSILWTAGYMGFLGIPINILTTIVPALLFVVGSTEDVHILWEYRRAAQREAPGRPAVARAVEKTGTAITLTALTTFLGFAATTVNPITLLRQFGAVASFGLIANPLLTCLIAPLFLRGVRPFSRRARPPGITDGLDRFFRRLADGIVAVTRRRRREILGGMLLASLAAGLLALRVEVDNDPLGYFKESSELVRRSRTLHERMSGSQVFQLRLSGGFPGAFLRPENLKEIEKLQRYIAKSGRFDTSLSLADYLAYLHSIANGGNPAFHRVPDDEETVTEYVRILQADWPSRYAARDLSEAGITVTHRMSSSRHFLQALKDLEAFIAREVDPHLLTRVTGRSVLMNQAALSMTLGQVQSISIILAAILAIVSFLFLNIRVGLLALVPNLFPIVLVFGIMGLFGIPLNVGTAMVAAISIGIAVDNTIHMFFRYNQEVRRLNRADEALAACIRAEIRPVVVTSLGLALGFGVLGLSSFSPIAHFGLLSAAVMVLAVLADLLLTPVLLSGTQIITLWDTVQTSLQKEVLEQVDIFRGMKPSQIKKLVLMGRLCEAGAGEVILQEGAQGDEMFLLLEGRARIFVTNPDSGEEVLIHSAGPGTVIGEIALMTSVKRTASVRAEEPLTYITYDGHTIDRVKRHAPHLAAQLFQNLSRIMVVRLQELAAARPAAGAH